MTHAPLFRLSSTNKIIALFPNNCYTCINELQRGKTMKDKDFIKEFTKDIPDIEQHSEEDIMRALACLDAVILFNLYTNENIIFKKLKPTEPIPFQKYIDELGIQSLARFLDSGHIDGDFINNSCVAELDFDACCFNYFKDRIDYMFEGAPISKNFDDEKENDIEHYKNGLYEYLKALYPMFAEIIKTDVEPDLFAAVPNILDKSALYLYYKQIMRFVKAIKMKHLKQGSCIDRYVKEMPLLSPFIKRLVRKHKGHFVLANSDTNSLDYKLALFSCFRFYNEENAKLFELKMLQWEENNK